jgi:uncharacterized membrane protein HdeD (DUF308 family)
MTSSAAHPEFGRAGMVIPESEEALRTAVRLWWAWLVVGILWMVAALVILQFDRASITTVGVILGIMFAVAALQQFAYAAVADSLRWLWVLFGVLFSAAAIIAFINPKETFAGLADVSGFLFLTVGVWWIVRAVLERAVSALWWLGLIAGGLMVILAFWTSGQFFIEKVYTLLVFAGIWALLQGVGSIGVAFAVRSMRDEIY